MKKQNTKAPAGRAAPLGPTTAGENSHVLTSEGDIAPTLTRDGVLAFSVDEATQGKQEAEIAAIDAMLNGPPKLSAGSEFDQGNSRRHVAGRCRAPASCTRSKE